MQGKIPDRNSGALAVVLMFFSRYTFGVLVRSVDAGASGINPSGAECENPGIKSSAKQAFSMILMKYLTNRGPPTTTSLFFRQKKSLFLMF